MRRVFADAVYWVAFVQRKDQWHAQAVRAASALQGAMIITTEEILDEFLAYFSDRGMSFREIAIRTIEDVLSDPSVIVRPQSHQTFTDGFSLYKARPDKGYSLTDCISMVAMRQEGITEILTHDDHFTREGFIKLL